MQQIFLYLVLLFLDFKIFYLFLSQIFEYKLLSHKYFW